MPQISWRTTVAHLSTEDNKSPKPPKSVLASAPPGVHHLSVPNGKPGDHPLTDLLHWKSPVFGDPVDNLLREIVKLGGESVLDRSPWRERLWDLWPRWSRDEAKDVEIAALVEPLTQLRDRLKTEAIERGWEIE